jgi:hypothetical protein
MAGEKIGDVFIQVTTNARKAAEDMRAAVNATQTMIETNVKLADAIKELQAVEEERAKASKSRQSKAEADIRKQIGDIDAQIAKLTKLGAVAEDQLKKQIRMRTKLENISKILDIEERKRTAAFTDYAGTQAEQRARRGEKVSKKELENIQGFLSRAANEHSRFSDRLDRRDMTRSIAENIRRGFEKGLLIGQKWHKDENAVQRYARALGIAGASLERVKSSAERAANAFYKMQRVGYLLQTVLSIVVGSIGALVGGILALVGVAGAAIASMTALGGAMAGVGAGFIAAKVAMGGVMAAVSQSTQAQIQYSRALTVARRELQGLKFDAEEAALSEQEAAISLEKAREELARVQDLPPDSRLRRETELQYQQAELNYRRAKARNELTAKQAAEGVAGIIKRNNPGGMNQAMNLLTASQRKFAEYLIGIKPKYRELKEAAAGAFLGPLQQAIDLVTNKMLPTLKNGLVVLGSAMGGAMLAISKGFTNKENLKLLNEFFKDSIPSIKAFGDSVSASFGGLLAMLHAAAPITARFSEWVTSSAKGFESWAKSGLADGSLTRFFNLSGDVAAKLGDVFGKVFDGIRNIVNATFPGGDVNAGAGGVILQWLSKIAEGFRMFTSSAGFAQWLKTTTETATIAFSTIGQILHILLDTADRPELKNFFLILQGAVAPLRKLFTDGIAASPAFARLVVSIAKFFAALSDSSALTIFMDTLSTIVESLAGFFEIIKPLLDTLNKFHAFILAATAVTFLFAKAGMVAFGILEKGAIAVGGVGAAVFKTSSYITAFRSNVIKLRTDGSSLVQALVKTSMEMKKIVFSATAKRKQEFLLEMARAAGATNQQLKSLNIELDKARQKGAITLKGLSAGVRANGGIRSNSALDMAGIGGEKLPFSKTRTALGGVGGAFALGLPQALASAVGVPMQGALSQILGAVSMFTSFIPGLPGLIISSLVGLGSIVAGAIEGANLTAQAELDHIKLVTANDIKSKLLTIEKTKQIGESFIAAGLSPKKAAIATERLRLESQKISGTETATNANLGASGIKAIITELMSQGGADVTRTLVNPSSQAAQDLIQTAVNATAAGRTAQSKNITIDEISSGVSTALARIGAGGKRLGAIKYDAEGRIVTGEAARTATTVQNLNFRSEQTKIAEAKVKEAADRARLISTNPVVGRVGSAAANPTGVTTPIKPPPPMEISPKSNTVKLEEAKELKEATLSTAINLIRFFTANPVNEIANYYIDGKTVSKDEFKKTGLSP